MRLTAPEYIAFAVAVAVAVNVSGTAAASPSRSGAAFPIAKLTVEATLGGEAANLDLGEDGNVTLRAPLVRGTRSVARVVGSTVVAASDGRVLASLGPRGRLDIGGLDGPMRLRGCALSGPEEGELTLKPDGTFYLKPPGQKRFSLPAGVRGAFRRACPTALVLYRMLPLLVDGRQGRLEPASGRGRKNVRNRRHLPPKTGSWRGQSPG